MNMFHVERLRATAIARCRDRLERSGKTPEQLAEWPASHFSLRTRHGLTS